jgi:EAL domain-containing protein (putative c-di-GMP-specific phosphodiesterase class I)
VGNFGPGQDFLENLQKLPSDKIRIDRSFIRDASIDDCDEDVTKVIVF